MKKGWDIKILGDERKGGDEVRATVRHNGVTLLDETFPTFAEGVTEADRVFSVEMVKAGKR